ncbi:hypothetical protein [Streptosporangium sp. 'caverna']|uniref:hypothetical protein n=1 Tax=Streptosporangium sp. 'caverna' TaxID=2202249 RepID=UPI000D7E8D0C|nr:hypothetical protein [Streptosporangium sp. 'caverna']AWS45484.1 hypothetical protein DKM19_33305 [Streptosporangium sp. 'caverna']
MRSYFAAKSERDLRTGMWLEEEQPKNESRTALGVSAPDGVPEHVEAVLLRRAAAVLSAAGLMAEPRPGMRDVPVPQY